MPLTVSKLAAKLQTDLPQFTFTPSLEHKWLPATKEIHYNPEAKMPYELLHEIAHGLLGHWSYDRDIALLGMERDAWQYVSTTLAPQYFISIPDEYITRALDSYREWLHARAACPHCKATGVQAETTLYTCLSCDTTWHVNDARTCQLRRTTLTKKHPL